MYDEIEKALLLLEKADRFYFGKAERDDIWIVRTDHVKDTWKIWNGSSVYNTFQEWEWEPQPSSRNDEFFSRTRYDLETAVKIAEKLVAA